MQDIKYNQQLIGNNLQNLKTELQQNMIRSIGEDVPVHWTQETQIKWPLTTKEEYDKLNLLLADEKIRKDFVISYYQNYLLFYYYLFYYYFIIIYYFNILLVFSFQILYRWSQLDL